MENKNPSTGKFLFRKLGIQSTVVRQQMLHIMENAQKPLSSKEIEEKMGAGTDRVTVYRTLKMFVDKGLLHRIDISDSLTAYRLASDGENPEHVHFHCTECHQVYCMPQLPVAQPNLPEGFAPLRNRLVVDGKCNRCNTPKSCR
ncbi:MAG: transcriptional repressor [Breznakibacter sp.]